MISVSHILALQFTGLLINMWELELAGRLLPMHLPHSSFFASMASMAWGVPHRIAANQDPQPAIMLIICLELYVSVNVHEGSTVSHGLFDKNVGDFSNFARRGTESL